MLPRVGYCPNRVRFVISYARILNTFSKRDTITSVVPSYLHGLQSTQRLLPKWLSPLWNTTDLFLLNCWLRQEQQCLLQRLRMTLNDSDCFWMTLNYSGRYWIVLIRLHDPESLPGSECADCFWMSSMLKTGGFNQNWRQPTVLGFL
jgi:hypothetical protein